MNRNQAVTHFKQLCYLGLPGQAVVPALLETLHRIIPADASCVAWSDGHGRGNTILVENTGAAAPVPPVFRGCLAELREWQLRAGGAEMMLARGGGESPREMAAPDNPGGSDRPPATGIISRSYRDARFGVGDRRQLHTLLPHFAHALDGPEQDPTPFVDSDREGFLITDRHGVIQHLSPGTEQLLYQTQLCALGRGPGLAHSHSPLRAKLLRLLKMLEGDAGGAAEPPLWRHTTPWGIFVFRAYFLESSGGWLEGSGESQRESGAELAHHLARETDATGLALIRLRLQEPLPIKLMRQLQQWPLSPRQREIALWLARGFNLGNIGRQLHISERTAAAHTRTIYEKLEVHSRAELVCKLLA